jgi:hypothetical protein
LQIPKELRVVDIRRGTQPKMAVPRDADRRVFEAETIWSK